MKKYIILFLLSLIFIFPSTVYASDKSVVDDADLLTVQEEQELNKIIDKIENKYDIDLFIYTFDKDIQNTRDYVELYGEQNFGDEYIGLSINMNSRDYVIDIYGEKLFDIFTDNVQIKIENNIVNYLSADEYYEAFLCFFDNVENELQTNYFIPIGIAFIGAIIISGSMTIIQLNKHKEKKTAKTAENYVLSGGNSINLKEDKFIREYTTKTAKQTSSSNSGRSRTTTHRSSSGSRHSGRSGKF